MKQKNNQEKRGQIMFTNIFIVFLVVSIAAFCIDGFLLHPIPNQGERVTFDLSKTDTVYADAEVLHVNEICGSYSEVLLVEKDGQRHLILFTRHQQTKRYAFRDEAVVAPDYTGSVTLRHGVIQEAWIFENGEVVNQSAVGPVVNNGASYMGIAMAVTAAESMILWKFLKKKYPNE